MSPRPTDRIAPRAGLRAYRLVAVAAALSGCAALHDVGPARNSVVSPELRECGQRFAAIDAAVEAAGTRDAEAHRIRGFPYLRIDRFLASLRDRAAADPAAFDTWFDRLAALDVHARRIEADNTPERHFAAAGLVDREAALTAVRECASVLARYDRADAAARERLLARTRVPDAYATGQRIAGLYALTSLPISAGIDAMQAQTRRQFARADRPGTQMPVIRYTAASSPATPSEVAGIVTGANRDALGVPRLSARERSILLDAYAPAYEVETAAGHDRIGALALNDAGPPRADTSRPTVYSRVAYTRFGGQTLIQLVYTAWFPQRPADGPLDMLAGHLDGVVLRVTLDADGAPLVYDTMHPCGCYHLFVPTARVEPVPSPQPAIEWAFAPARLPVLAPGARVSVRIESRTHYVVGLRPAADEAGIVYALVPEDTLRSLPTGQGGSRSVYGPDGLVRGTERAERFLFWPMGIASAGAMRQWGGHATAFVGRRHFDDADLIERRFVRSEPPGAPTGADDAGRR